MPASGFVVMAVTAPVLSKIDGADPYYRYGQKRHLLNQYGTPLGKWGGISSEHWLGLEPGLGRDVLMQLVYGARTSLFGLANSFTKPGSDA